MQKIMMNARTGVLRMVCLRPGYFVGVVLACLACLLVPVGQAFAANACTATVTGGAFSGTPILIPRDAQVGDPIGSAVQHVISISCGPSMGDYANKEIGIQFSHAGQRVDALSGPDALVFALGDSGVGVKVTLPYYPSVDLNGNSGARGAPGFEIRSGSIPAAQANMSFSYTVRQQLVKLGTPLNTTNALPISSDLLKLDWSIPNGTNSVAITNGVIRANTVANTRLGFASCTPENITVTLAAAKAKNLRVTSPSMSARVQTPFVVTLRNCPALNMALHVTLDSPTKSTTIDGLMLPSNAPGMARGVGIQLLTGDQSGPGRYPLDPGARKGVPFNKRLDYGRTNSASTIQLGFIAQYLRDRSQPILTGGQISTSATYTIEYQ